MRFLRFLSALFVIFVCAAYPQNKAESDCPKIKIIGPAGFIHTGDFAIFAAEIDPRSAVQKSSFSWAVSAGEIGSGQGTEVIEVRIPSTQDVIATIQIEGLDRSCPAKATAHYKQAADDFSPVMIEVLNGPQYALDQRKLNRLWESADSLVRPRLFVVIGVKKGEKERSIRMIQNTLRRRLVKTNIDHSRISYAVDSTRDLKVRLYLVTRIPPTADRLLSN